MSMKGSPQLQFVRHISMQWPHHRNRQGLQTVQSKLQSRTRTCRRCKQTPEIDKKMLHHKLLKSTKLLHHKSGFI